MSNLKIVQLTVGPMENFSYLVSGNNKEAVVIDPGWDAEKILNEAKNHNWKIVAVLLTHSHFDHARETGTIVKETACPVYVHPDDVKELPKFSDLIPTYDNDILNLVGTEFKVLHMPGHTEGSQCFLTENNLFTGDVLFVEACGRVDLPGSNPDKMEKSLAKIAKLQPEIIVYPGHDYGSTKFSTIERELNNNPYLSRHK